MPGERLTLPYAAEQDERCVSPCVVKCLIDKEVYKQSDEACTGDDVTAHQQAEAQLPGLHTDARDEIGRKSSSRHFS